MLNKRNVSPQSCSACLVARVIFGNFASMALVRLALKKRGLSHVVQPVWLQTMFWPDPFRWVQDF